MHWPLLHRNDSSGQVFDAERYIMINYQWFCACSYRINLIEMVSVIEFTRIYHHAAMHTLLKGGTGFTIGLVCKQKQTL